MEVELLTWISRYASLMSTLHSCLMLFNKKGIEHFFLQVTSFIIKMTISPMIKLMFLLPFANQTRCFLIVSNSKLASLKIFRRDVPIRKLGRVWALHRCEKENLKYSLCKRVCCCCLGRTIFLRVGPFHFGIKAMICSKKISNLNFGCLGWNIILEIMKYLIQLSELY